MISMITFGKVWMFLSFKASVANSICDSALDTRRPILFSLKIFIRKAFQPCFFITKDQLGKFSV